MINNLMIKQKLQTQHLNKNLKKTISLLAIALVVAVLSGGGLVRADQYEDKINQLRADSNAKQTQSNRLQSEADSLENTVAGLRSQIEALESQIRENQAKANELQRQIHEAEIQLAEQKKLLGQNIKAMYMEDEISTFEVLMSSNDLGEYVDREQYRVRVEDKIESAMKKIEELQQSLASKKAELDKNIADQKAIQSQLDTQRAEQNRLLALNQQQRNELDGQIRANSSQIAKLRSEQAAANARLFGRGTRNVPDSTGYPWANAPFPNTMSDPWGMYKRQCVSYTAWKVHKSGRHMPYWGGRGNANEWDDNARAAGIPTDSNPRVGDVAISNRGYYGHAMYVEAVYGDGTIYISQYNGSNDGRYSEARISARGLVFIHF